MINCDELPPPSPTNTNLGMGSDDYTDTGVMYNYDIHPKTKKFTEAYFSISQLKLFVKEMQKRSTKVLDLGSGVGFESNYLKQTIPNGQVFSLDISDFGSKSGKINFDLNQVQADIRTPPFADQSFDGIHCKDVLVHVHDKNIFFENISRILKDNGLLVVVSSPVAYEKFKQYNWNEEAVIDIAREFGLEIVQVDHIQIEEEDWYSVPRPRTILTFRKVSKMKNNYHSKHAPRKSFQDLEDY